MKPLEHGTRSTYAKGCRCRPCTKANTDYSRERYYGERAATPYDPDALQVECWCHYKSVWVPRRELLAGLTRSCGLPACDAKDLFHRKKAV